MRVFAGIGVSNWPSGGRPHSPPTSIPLPLTLCLFSSPPPSTSLSLPSLSQTPCSAVQVTAQGQWDDITGRLLAACMNAAQQQSAAARVWHIVNFVTARKEYKREKQRVREGQKKKINLCCSTETERRRREGKVRG